MASHLTAIAAINFGLVVAGFDSTASIITRLFETIF